MKFTHQATPGRIRKSKGFSLMEVMITIAILGLLAAIAFPSYQSYIIRGNRSAAQSFMLEVASKQERYLLDSRTYAADIATLGMTVPSSVSANYTITSGPVVGPPPGYTVTAVPIGNQLANDTLCGTLSIDATATKTASGSGGVSQCWKQ